MEKKVLTIKRSEWRRGTLGKGPSLLLNKEGFKCCLGFDALQFGLSKEAILGSSAPLDVGVRNDDNDLVKINQLYNTRCSLAQYAINSAISINDRERLVEYVNGKELINPYTEETREATLIPILKRLGWDDVVFVD